MGTLYVIPTPVGNLDDMTARSLEVLRRADLILAEDTRTSGVLLKHFSITNELRSYHKFNEHSAAAQYAARMAAGETMALISDAGTPAISDPGFLLVRECVKLGVTVECLPGATAFVPALVDSALPCERFVFEGFLPVKKGRAAHLAMLAEEERTMVFYEAPFRVVRTLEQFVTVFGSERNASASREISKLHEETVRGTIEQLLNHFKENEPRGEFVIVVEGLNRKHKNK